jgi:hypothetical protein
VGERCCEAATYLAETMHVRDGTAELHGCVVHDSESEGVLADSYQFNAASVVLVDTIVERCKAWSVYSCGGGVVSLVGDRNIVRHCTAQSYRSSSLGDAVLVMKEGDGAFAVEDGRETGGRIDGVAPELVTQLQEDEVDLYGDEDEEEDEQTKMIHMALRAVMG